jgi:hypothetical protein
MRGEAGPPPYAPVVFNPKERTMSLSVNGVSPVSFASPPPAQPGGGLSFDQLINQLAGSFGVSPQELFNMITSYSSQPSGGGSPVPGAGGPGGGASDAELQKVLGQFAANTLNAGQGMVKEAMEKFFEEEEPDEDDPDAEPL